MSVVEDTWSPGAETPSMAYRGRIRAGTTTPNFGSLPKDEKPVNHYSAELKGGINNRLYTQSMTVLSSGDTYYAYLNRNFYTGTAFASKATGRWLSGNSSWLNEKLSAENECEVGALVKMADAKVNVAVAFAEASKTSDLIYDTARRIDRAYRAFRRGDLRGVANNLNITPKKLHNSWLEYKYGWMPLLMDVKGAAEFFAQQHVTRPTRFKVERNIKRAQSLNETTYDPAYGGGEPQRSLVVSDASYQVRVVYWCELSYPHAAAMQQIGLTNPALVAWELVPYSFVFDWFIHVGDYLTALTAQNGVTVRRGMKSTIEDIKYHDESDPTFRSDTLYAYYTSGGSCNAFYRKYVRAPSAPDPGSLYPPVVNSFGFAKLVTSLALIRGSYRGNARL